MSETCGAGNWFEHWFDSPYYHILYQHRDEEEAEYFLDNLLTYLKPQSGSQMLDLACGRGRHSVYLHGRGFDITGVDLAPRSIEYARQFEKEGLRFEVHDMRNILASKCYDYVFNLFTSFGYFQFDHENERAVHTMATALKPGGILVLDFLNAEAIPRHATEDLREYEGYRFVLNKRIEGDRIVKSIRVEKEGRSHTYEERVQLLIQRDFERYFDRCGLELVTLFGDYALNPYRAEESDRIIFIARKR